MGVSGLSHGGWAGLSRREGKGRGCLIAGEGGPPWPLCGSQSAWSLGHQRQHGRRRDRTFPEVGSGRHPGLNSKILGSELEITPLPPSSYSNLGMLPNLSVAHLCKSTAVPPPKVS